MDIRQASFWQYLQNPINLFTTNILQTLIYTHNKNLKDIQINYFTLYIHTWEKPIEIRRNQKPDNIKLFIVQNSLRLFILIISLRINNLFRKKNKIVTTKNNYGCCKYH